MVAGPPLERLFDRLGLAYDPDGIAATLAQEHSYDAKSAMLFRGCRLQISSRHVLDRHLEYYRIENPSFEKAGSTIIGGILLPREGREIDGPYCSSPGRDSPVPGKFQLPSPGVAKRYPGMAQAAHARFSIEITSLGGVHTIAMRVAGEEIELAKFYPAPDGRQFNLHPAVAQTGELTL